MKTLMIGAICTKQCPLEIKVRGYTKPRTDMWLYTLKQWMEQNNITVKWAYSEDSTRTTGIMDVKEMKSGHGCDRRDVEGTHVTS